MSGSTVLITYNGIDITSDVLYASATFESQMNAVPGTCSFKVQDLNQTHSFITGKEIRLFIDGIPMWGGYVRRVNMGFPFEADDTSTPDEYPNRVWEIQGTDYNILFDTLIIRRTSNYTGLVPDATGYAKGTDDGWALWKMLYSFSDFPSGFNITATRSGADTIDDITTVLPSTSNKTFHYKQQGTKLRDQFDELAKQSGAVYYISADKKVHYHAYEDVQKRWGFSDDPNYAAITTSPATFQNATYGFREVTGEEDGTLITNDAFIWGGSPLGSDGTTLFARYQDAVEDVATTSSTYVQSGATVSGSSIYTHGRWQIAETHFDGGMYGNLDGVKARANVILNGPPGATGNGVLKGLRYPQWSFQFNWYAERVPILDGAPDHIIAGDIVSISLDTFGVEQFAPCRSVRITFPGQDPSGKSFVLFSGEFSFSYTDPISLWKMLLKATDQRTDTINTATSANNDSTVTSYGAFGTFTPVETPNGVTTVFTLPNGIGYIWQSTQVYLNGLIQRLGTDYYETSGPDGTITFSSAPVSTDLILIICRTLAT